VGLCLYYWGNHAFTTSITPSFPDLLQGLLELGADVTVSTFRLGLANSIASLVVAVTAPVLGAIADRGGHAKRFLVARRSSVRRWCWRALVGKGEWQWASRSCARLARLLLGNVFGDSMLVSVAEPGKLEITSAVATSRAISAADFSSRSASP